MQSEVAALVERVCVWIKLYAHPIRVFGGVFLALAFISGILWICGRDIEPLAFTFALLSSSLFGMPSAASYFLPDRKPVSMMHFDEVLEFITSSDPKEDWSHIETTWAEEAFLKEEPRLRFRARKDDLGTHCKGFSEAWAQSFPDSAANSYWYELVLDGALIDRYILVAVDGARAFLPLPNLQTMTAPQLHYKVAQIFDTSGTLDEYMKRAKIELESDITTA